MILGMDDGTVGVQESSDMSISTMMMTLSDDMKTTWKNMAIVELNQMCYLETPYWGCHLILRMRCKSTKSNMVKQKAMV